MWWIQFLLTNCNRRDRPITNDHPEEPAYCKWSSRGTGLLKMIIWMDQPLANDHPDGPASCKWSSRETGLLQMIIWMGQPLANDHPDGSASCKWSSRGTGLLKMIIRRGRHLLLQNILSSSSNLRIKVQSRTTCSCNLWICSCVFRIWSALSALVYFVFGEH